MATYETVKVQDLPGRFYTSEERSWRTIGLPEKLITEKTYVVLQSGTIGDAFNALETTSEEEAIKKAEKASKLNGPEYVKIVVVLPVKKPRAKKVSPLMTELQAKFDGKKVRKMRKGDLAVK